MVRPMRISCPSGSCFGKYFFANAWFTSITAAEACVSRAENTRPASTGMRSAAK
jgi:hypothetical protein